MNEDIFITKIKNIYKKSKDPKLDLLDSCKVILIIAGSDGEVSEGEWNTLFQFIDQLGGSMMLMKELDKFDYLMTPLESVVSKVNPSLHRVLLYFALKAARVDGLAIEERDKAIEFANLIGIDENTAKSIENILNLEDNIIKLTVLGFKNITLVGSSTACPLIIDLLKRNYFQNNLKNIFFVDPIIIPSDKMLGLIGVIGPVIGYIETDLDAGEAKYWYKYRPYQTLEELNTLIIKVRKQLEGGININNKYLKVFKSLNDASADPVSAVLLYKGISTSSGKIDVEMINSNLHVYTRLDLRPKASAKDVQNQQNTFDQIIKKSKQ